jgi:hypothetical protein
MNLFGTPPDDLDNSQPAEPMKLNSIGEQKEEFRLFLSELVDTHKTKLKIKEKHKLRDVYRQILLNVVYNSSRNIYTAIPRGKPSFDPGKYWRSIGLTFRLTIAALNRLNAEGFIIQHAGFFNGPAGFGRLTRIYGTEKLSDRINAVSITDHLELITEAEDSSNIGVETLILKGFPYESNLLAQYHPDVVRLKVINDFLKDYSWSQKGPIRLIYSGEPLRGGRLYTRFQNIPKALRAELKINGLSTVELDYKSNHLMMLIALSGMELSADPYMTIADLANQSREVVKKYINTCISAISAKQAFNACKQHKINRELFNKLEIATITAFPDIKLYVGIGVYLQSLEGQIALNIMVEGANNNIPVLPVHDSFITTTDNEQWLRDQMMTQWKEQVMTIQETRIEKK